jgi:hypothetical protein
MADPAKTTPDAEKSSRTPGDSDPSPRGSGVPSWGLMLFFIFLAMLAAIAIAWAFVTPLLHRHF